MIGTFVKIPMCSSPVIDYIISQHHITLYEEIGDFIKLQRQIVELLA